MPFNRSSSFRTSVRVRSLALVLALASPPLLLPASAAAGAPGEEDEPRADRPPAEMSEIGGERLGRPGTQVDDGAGVPALPEDLTSRSWIVADAENGDVLAAHNAHWPLAPASTLKMLFADVLLPEFEPDEEYRARPEHFTELGEGSSRVGLDDGQTYTVEDLWLGVFLASGNDAVYALAAMNGGKEETVEAMNERARELQALDTHVVNPDGYDAEGQTSSAYDLTLIARDAMQNEDFRTYVSTERADFPGEGSGEDRETYEIVNTNRLLVGAEGLEPYQGLAGVKNGYTSEAGHTFTGVAERDGRVLLVTCMAPEGDNLAVYREAADLLDWGFAAAGEAEPVGELVPPRDRADDADGPDGSDGAPSDGHSGDEAPDGPADPAVSDGATAAGTAGRSAAPLVAGVTAGALALLATGAYLFHRRHPLPIPGRRNRSAPGA